MFKKIGLKTILSFAILLFLFFANCERNKGINTPELSASADYLLTFESTWSNITHPTNFPASAHFSGLVGATHNSNISFWQAGLPASLGIKDVAERGLKDQFKAEIQTAIQKSFAGVVLDDGGIAKSPGSVSFSFKITRNFHL